MTGRSSERDLVVSDRKEPFLRIEGLTKNFAGQFALNGVSFDLHRGEILGLIGPNGAGKTTLFETLAGILPADDGRITSEGNDIPQLGDGKRCSTCLTAYARMANNMCCRCCRSSRTSSADRRRTWNRPSPPPG